MILDVQRNEEWSNDHPGQSYPTAGRDVAVTIFTIPLVCLFTAESIVVGCVYSSGYLPEEAGKNSLDELAL